MNWPERTRDLFDEPEEKPALKIWGAPAIAKYLGVSVVTVYTLARDPNCPVRKPRGYFAYRHELDAWLRTKPPP